MATTTLTSEYSGAAIINAVVELEHHIKEEQEKLKIAKKAAQRELTARRKKLAKLLGLTTSATYGYNSGSTERRKILDGLLKAQASGTIAIQGFDDNAFELAVKDMIKDV